MKRTHFFIFCLFTCLLVPVAHSLDGQLKLTVEKANKALKEVKKIGTECISCEASGVMAPPPSQFSADEVDQSKFIVVSAPVGSSGRSQLNIYEQILDPKKCKTGKHCLCYRSDEDSGVVTPILGRTDPKAPQLGVFDFTGKCRRYIDGNGYMVRMGNEDLSNYSLRIINRNGVNVLIAVNGSQEIEIGKTKTSGVDFFKIDLNSGWRLMRRSFQGKPLGFVYLYHD